MPTRRRNLDFSSGFAGPPIPTDQTGQGVPDVLNMRAQLGGLSLESWEGFRRAMAYDLWNGTPGDELRIMSFTAAAFGMSDGRGLAVIDGRNGRPLGFAYHPGGDTHNPETAPSLLGTMNRQTPNDYPAMQNFRGRTFIGTGWENMKVWDGETLRNAGIPSPRLKPTVTISTLSQTGLPLDDATPDTDVSAWVRNTVGQPTSGSVVTARSETNPPAVNDVSNFTSTHRTQLTIGATIKSNANMVHSNDPSQTINATEEFVSFWIYYESAAGKFMPASKFALVFADTADLVSTSVPNIEIVIDNQIPPNQWTLVTLPWEETVNFTCQSFGLKLATEFAEDQFEGSEIKIFLDQWLLGTADPGIISGDLLVAVSYYDSKRDLESGLSPFSDVLDVPDNGGVNIDISGFYQGIVAGAVNTALVDTGANRGGSVNGEYEGQVDKVRVYFHKPEFGTENFQQATSSIDFPLTRLAIEIDIPTIDSSSDASPGKSVVPFTNQRTLNAILADIGPPLFKGFPPATSRIAAGVKRMIAAGQEDYAVGQVSVTQESNIASLVIPSTGSASSWFLDGDDNTGTGSLSAGPTPTSAVVTETWVIVATSPTAFTVTGSVSGLQVATGTVDSLYTTDAADLTFTLTGVPVSGDTHTFKTFSVAHDTPVFGLWMEGRSFQVEGDEREYGVLKVIDSNADGVYDQMWIGTGPGLLEPYQGATDATASYRLAGDPDDVFFSANTTDRGIQPEQFPVQNTVEVNLPNDAINAIATLGEGIFAIFGRQGVHIIREDANALDDPPGSFPAFRRPKLMSGAPGCLAPRTVASLPGGAAVYLGQENEVAVINPSGAQPYTLASNIKGWLSTESKVNPNMLNHAHGAYSRDKNSYFMFMAKQSSTFVEDPAPAAINSSEVVCSADGDQVNDAPPESEFDRVVEVAFDAIKNEKGQQTPAIWIGGGFNITALMDASAPCAPSGLLPDRLYGASADGFINRMFSSDAYGLGTPMDQIRYTVNLSTPFPDPAIKFAAGTKFETHGDGLKDLPFAIIGTAGTQTGVIASNTVDTITPVDALATDPEGGDIFIIGALSCSILFREEQFDRPARVNAIQPRFKFTTPVTPSVQFEVFGASDDAINATTGTSKAISALTLEALKLGQGWVFLPPHNSKALIFAISFTKPDQGTFTIGPLEIEELFEHGESARGFA